MVREWSVDEVVDILSVLTDCTDTLGSLMAGPWDRAGVGVTAGLVWAGTDRHCGGLCSEHCSSVTWWHDELSLNVD